MSEVFFISDTHFNHPAILKFEPGVRKFDTIEEHDQFLIDQWNNEVGKRDIVFHLGDVCFGSQDRFQEIFKQLNGDKRLILGNHDLYPTHLYIKYFRQVYGALAYKGYWLTHIPIHPNCLGHPVNIHGHLHHRVIADPRYVCVSVEQTNLKPVAFDSIKDSLKNIGVL